jgi:hypothetical protein
MNQYFNSMSSITVACIMLIGISSCGNRDTESRDILTLDLENRRDNTEEIRLSEFISDVTYIRLETTPECLISRSREVSLLGDFIFVVERNGCYLFDRSTGSFVREIGRPGRGPGEYTSFGFIDGERHEIFLTDYKGTLLRYNLSGELTGSLTVPGKSESSHILSTARLDDKSYVSYYLNLLGDEERLAVIWDESGATIRIFRNRQFINQRKNLSFARNMGVLQRIDDRLILNIWNNDTVFEVRRDTLVPYFILNRGEYCPPYDFFLREVEEMSQLVEQKRVISNFNFRETDRFILFEIYSPVYFALYDKAQSSFRVTEKEEGLINDLGLPLQLYWTSITDGGEMPLIHRAEEVIKWLSENPDAMASKPDLLESLKNIKPEDNPVVAIARIKD